MSTSQKPHSRRPLPTAWTIFAIAVVVVVVLANTIGPSDALVIVWEALGLAFLILLIWTAHRGGWLKGLLITLAVIALAFGICVVVVVSSFE